MPNFDRTGPQGQGELTGRKRGRCNNTQTAQSEKITEQSTENKNIIFGIGRGGEPRGGAGLGNHFGGGGSGRGRRFRR